MGMLLVRSNPGWGTRIFSLHLFDTIRYFHFTNYEGYPQYLFKEMKNKMSYPQKWWITVYNN